MIVPLLRLVYKLGCYFNNRIHEIEYLRTFFIHSICEVEKYTEAFILERRYLEVIE